MTASPRWHQRDRRMKRYCAGCPEHRAHVAELLPPCKRVRLCKVVDIGLIDRYRGCSLASYVERARDIEAAYATTSLWLGARPTPIAEGEEFLRTAIEVHRRVFERGDPNIAGRLRDAPVFFGRGRLNHREGIAAAGIERALRSFDLAAVPHSVHEAAFWGAHFLRRFFVIHPFEDGNGRVGRLLMTHFIEHTGLITVSARHDRSSTKYLCALEYAHRHADDPHPSRNPLRWLAKYLESQLAMTPTEEEEPPFPGFDSGHGESSAD